MAQYNITSPDGQNYSINAPDDATEDQVLSYAQKNFKMAAKPEPEKTMFQRLGDLSQGYDDLKANIGAGLVRGAGSIGATLLRPFETSQENAMRRKQMDEGLKSLTGANPESFGYGAGKLGGELLGTGGVGSLLGKGAARFAPQIASALRTGGMTTGAVLPESAKWLGARGVDALTRAGAGAAVGGASAGMVNPDDIGVGAAIGGATPFVLQGAGKLGGAVAESVRGNKQGKMLAEALGGGDLSALATALRRAPASIVEGSPLTVSQALQTQGANTPAVKMLERTVAGGRSGDPLLQMFANQGEARLSALANEGAQTYQGAAREEATNVGNKLGSLLRTQATDEQAANRVLWEQLNQRALREGTSVQLPIAEMEAAMSPLGRGSVVAGTDANKVLSMAKQIGQDIPAAAPMNKAVPFVEAQRLRRDSGSLAAKAAEKGDPTEAGVLASFQESLSKRFDDAAGGNLLQGESISPEFMGAYTQARNATKVWKNIYDNGDNIASILRKPVGQDYRFTGDEIANKLWHGGAGLAGDVSKFKGALNSSNYQPAMDAYQRMILTDAASKTTAAGQFGSALPKYVELRMPGLQEALNPSQMKTLSDVARDIRNAEAAASVPGLRGSDTQAKIDRALGAGLLDSNALKSLSGLLSVKGVGLESLRGKAAESMIKYKGDKIADLLANPLKAAKALDDATFVKKLDSESLKLLRTSVLRASPILAAD